MLTLVIVMSGILVLATLVVVYVAFPHRGEDVPAVPWVGEAMRRGIESMPRLDETHGDRVGANRR